jgi:Fe2+ transport system protein B
MLKLIIVFFVIYMLVVAITFIVGFTLNSADMRNRKVAQFILLTYLHYPRVSLVIAAIPTSFLTRWIMG